jgi:hypothetical protein
MKSKKEKEKENKEEGIFRKNGVNGEMQKKCPFFKLE